MSSLMKDDSEYEQESLYQSVEESDAGVFDVNEPLSPDTEQFLNSINDDWGDEIISSDAESDSDKFIYPEIKDSEDDLSVSTEVSPIIIILQLIYLNTDMCTKGYQIHMSHTTTMSFEEIENAKCI